ncbi:MAG: hypothetical protein ABSA58_12915 [Acetobacteraceae bacterium]|jgi:hypothetical protein
MVTAVARELMGVVPVVARVAPASPHRPTHARPAETATMLAAVTCAASRTSAL